MESHLVLDIALCIIAAWVLGVAFQVVRQPLLLAYLVAGFAIGPNGFRWVTDPHSIETIASVGLILLLFMIGLEIDLKKMVSAGRMITTTAVCQILGSMAICWVLFKASGVAHSWFEALYLGVAAALSSTVIIVKVLYEKRELETLAGRITLGVLVLQDLFAILFLALQPNLKNPQATLIALALGKVVFLVAAGLLVSRYILPHIFKSVARVPELVLVGALAWCFALAGAAHQLGLSREMGALVAGVSISTYPYTLDVAAKVTTIRDFFVTLFFVGLGMTIPFPTIPLISGMLAVCCVLVLSRFLTVFPPLYLIGSGHRVSFLPALYLCQMSELSLVLLALGKASGDVSPQTMSIAALAFSFMAVNSTYGIFQGDTVLRFASGILSRVGLPDIASNTPQADAVQHTGRVFLLGCAWTSSSLLDDMRRLRPALLPDVVVIDYNPQVNTELRRRGVRVIYGDISQPDVLRHAGIGEAELVICALPNSLLKGANNLKLVRQVRSLNTKANVVAHAEKLADIATLYAAGASYVFAPRLLEAAHLLDVITAYEKGLLNQKREEQAVLLAQRDEILP